MRGSSSRLQAFDRGVELVQDQLEPELGDLMLDDEQHLVVLGRTADRLLRTQQLVELQIGVVADFVGADRLGFDCHWNVFFRLRFCCHCVRLGRRCGSCSSNHYNPVRAAYRSAAETAVTQPMVPRPAPIWDNTSI